MEKIINFKNKLLDFIYKYRFIIAIAFIIIGVLFKLHGSSISLWNGYVYNTGVEDKSLLFGNPRTIRSDEWAVTTPLIFSQSFNGFKYFSDILRGGTSTDAFTIYGLPVLALAEIFRPFHLGYIFLGLAHGLSFFWIARFISLFLITFEFAMILTNKNKRLSLIGSFMLSLSPIIQWWFATNGSAELFIFGELALVLLYKYMNTENFKIRLICLIFMAICAGGYILILYPAYQIPLFYVFLSLAIYIVVTNYKTCKITKKDIISIFVTLAVFILLIGSIFYTSKDTVFSLMNTVYPGNRLAEGSGGFRKYVSYIDNIFLTFKEEGILTSPSEESAMFSLFPIGIICAIIAMVKNKKVDIPLIVLFIPYIIIGAFAMFKVPLLAKITLLSYSVPEKAVIALGYIDILILLRSLSITTHSTKIWISVLISLITSLILVFICKTLNPDYVGKILASFLLVMSFSIFYFVLQYNTKYCKYIFTIGIIATMLVVGFKVNPICSGIDMITDSPMLQAIEEINKQDSGLWLAEALPFPCPNYLPMAGASTINATNIYPNMELWEMLDKDKKYEEVYNRYAHVYMEIVPNKEMISDKFVLLTNDKIAVYITPDELKDMNIKYIFTVRVMEDFKDENIDFDLIYNENNYHVYNVIYK